MRKKKRKTCAKEKSCIFAARNRVILRSKTRESQYLIKRYREMYAIVEIAGQQFKVTNGQRIFVNRLHEEEGSKVSFDKVLLIDNEGSTKVGAPTVAGANVVATILQHCKGNKVIVFKKKRRKGYQKSNGHRQYLSQIQIESITE